LRVPWPEQLERLLNRHGTEAYEVYSFAVDGGGLQNWHSIFFKEVLPHYQFDALLLAPYVDNLARPFSIACCKDGGGYFGRFAEPPRSLEEIDTAYLPKMSRVQEIAATDQIDGHVTEETSWSWQWPGLRLRTPGAIAAMIQAARDNRKRQQEQARLNEMEAFTSEPDSFSRQDLEDHYGKGVIERWYLILDHCRDHGIPVLLCTVPSREGAMEFSRIKGQGTCRFQGQVRSTAQLYGCPYFDGYQAFTEHCPETIRDKLWLKYDGHWAQEGADLFAEKLAEVVRHWQHATVARAHPNE